MKALIVGGDGFLGAALVDAARRAGLEVVRTSRRGNRTGAMFLDLAEPVGDIDLLGFDLVYLVAAVPSLVECERNPVTWRVNVDAPIELAMQATKAGAFVVFVSSDAVEFASNTSYGRQKMMAETAIRLLGAAIVRPTRIAKDRVGELCRLMLDVGRDRTGGVYRWA